MQAIDLISKAILPLNPRDPVARALDLMDEFKTSVLPVVANGRLLGLMKDSATLDNSNPAATVEKLMDRVEIPYVRDRQHLYDVLKLMAELGLPIVPVLDMGGNYLGVVSEHEAMRRMAELVNASAAGSVLVLEMARNDYSLQQIARIVEDEGARILSVYTSDLPDSMRMEVTLKVNHDDVRAILQAFERFEYTVHTTFQGSKAEDDLRDRYEDVMRIIKM
ncbi:MAG: CBS domain-containing protein [Flavobacteriales bacterium]|jgi:CBS domain-containing protein|nr:CBS domain-containing protein [Flavobacteriales bacterium]MBK6893257.1 CBS domain-containing protein [Flavobacteriales bacterium]MBK7249012.1 CBS domain-containing protein [Flavobacteriales bacterium]MBK7288510.1 CBS domain-containing protein [Flavobacteriales bacterium]MBK9058747.1 CBS domain-containing protein [Flavobacteriales bacterium]